MKTLASWPRIDIQFNREMIPVALMSPHKVPDEKWRGVDKRGHGHFWVDGELPTLEWVVTGTCWAGDEFDGEEYEVGEYRCRECGEVIEPGKKLEHGPTHIPGPTTVTVTLNEETFMLTPEQYADSVEAWAKSLRRLQR